MGIPLKLAKAGGMTEPSVPFKISLLPEQADKNKIKTTTNLLKINIKTTLLYFAKTIL